MTTTQLQEKRADASKTLRSPTANAWHIQKAYDALFAVELAILPQAYKEGWDKAVEFLASHTVIIANGTVKIYAQHWLENGHLDCWYHLKADAIPEQTHTLESFGRAANQKDDSTVFTQFIKGYYARLIYGHNG